MKKQCYMAVIYLNWLVFVGGLALFALMGDYYFVLIWLVGVPVFQWGYVRLFPAISRYMGYGSVDDRPAQGTTHVPAKVTLYTALSCPFCPVVKRRLLALQKEMGFDLQEVDVTLKPDLLIAKGISAVPVVEVGERRAVGHVTSEQLAILIRGSLKETHV